MDPGQENTWIDAALNLGSGALPPECCYVFHTKINKALNAAKKNGAVDVAVFDSKFVQFNGNVDGPSYKEVKRILEAGFVVIDLSMHGGVKLKKKAP
ncbi:hypothetical protein [Stenotrophomonas sp.]|uniref:hypothetical protein n=1 Tax=Stenotrophomonas sp. TaxID=69392 RepID=UPI002D6C5A8B|nr:hypothetical protein [Stenotrophomonas sp.]HYQ23381.1 hypothetical protein [Stenotrophomonas sp.]